MINVAREGDRLVFEVEGFDKFWALKSRLVIPVADVRSARRDPAVVKGWKGWRCPGTNAPGVLTAGTFYHDGKRVFWDIHDPERAVVVELDNERYDQLVIEVADPDAVVTMLNHGG